MFWCFEKLGYWTHDGYILANYKMYYDAVDGFCSRPQLIYDVQNPFTIIICKIFKFALVWYSITSEGRFSWNSYPVFLITFHWFLIRILHFISFHFGDFPVCLFFYHFIHWCSQLANDSNSLWKKLCLTTQLGTRTTLCLQMKLPNRVRDKGTGSLFVCISTCLVEQMLNTFIY